MLALRQNIPFLLNLFVFSHLYTVYYKKIKQKKKAITQNVIALSWARRIRTFRCWNQNPVPYRLAIAHYISHFCRSCQLTLIIIYQVKTKCNPFFNFFLNFAEIALYAFSKIFFMKFPTAVLHCHLRYFSFLLLLWAANEQILWFQPDHPKENLSPKAFYLHHDFE